MNYITINSLNIKIAELWQELENTDRRTYPKRYKTIAEERSALIRERNRLLHKGQEK